MCIQPETAAWGRLCRTIGYPMRYRIYEKAQPRAINQLNSEIWFQVRSNFLSHTGLGNNQLKRLAVAVVDRVY